MFSNFKYINKVACKGLVQIYSVAVAKGMKRKKGHVEVPLKNKLALLYML